jgi:hypothetical protein
MTKTDVSGSCQILDWTIIIYHSGETSLSEELIWSLKEMVRVGTPEKVAIVALMDTISADLWKFTLPANSANRRMMEKDPEGPSSDELETEGIFHSRNLEAIANPESLVPRDTKSGKPISRANLASSTLLRNFVIESIHQYKARHYMLILSGHGDGMIGKTLMVDEGASRFMSVPKLSWALGEIAREIGKVRKITHQGKKNPDKRLDILGFDSCGMLTAEVSHLLRREVKYIVGSEGIMNQSGWPYHLILDHLKTNQKVKPKGLANAIVERCVNYYADFSRVGVSIELAAVKLAPKNAKGQSWYTLIKKIKKLTEYLSNNIKDRSITNAVIAAHWYAQSYAIERYVDIKDFCEQLKLAEPRLSNHCNAVINALQKVVIISSYAGGEFQHSHGLSLFFPWCATDADLTRYTTYKPKGKKRTQTPFNRDTGWGEFLWDFIYTTRRKARDGNGDLIFMPPLGYRDHLGDIYANSQPDSAEQYRFPPGRTNPQNNRTNPQNNRTNPQNNRTNPQNNRTNPLNNRTNPQNNKMGISTFGFIKVKNPSFIFYENKNKDSKKTEPQESSSDSPAGYNT